MNDKFKKVAILAAEQAGELLIKEYYNFNRDSIKLKAHNEIVTRCDLLSEEIIIKTIRKNFPQHGIISEEQGELRGYDKYTWHIDPIDGTTNFSIRNPLWAVSLALAEENELIVGVIFAPILSELYWTVKNEGAWLRLGRSGFSDKQIKVSQVNSGKILNTFCHGRKMAHIKKAIAYYRRQKTSGFDCRQFGTAALELAYVAAGRVESFLAPGANDWDVAAGVLLVEEAGGQVTDFKNRPWRLGYGDIAASNGLVHKQILRVVNSK